MHKKKLTLNSTSRISTPAQTAAQITPNRIVAGRLSRRAPQHSCTALIERLRELVNDRRKVFIQMRHGTGYCGDPVLLEDGWLTMINVSIHGTKQSAVSQSIVIQINDGSFIAHVHPVTTDQKTGGAR